MICIFFYRHPEYHFPIFNFCLTQGAVVSGPTFFRDAPVRTNCPNCHIAIQSTVQYKSGTCTYLVCLGLCLVGKSAKPRYIPVSNLHRHRRLNELLLNLAIFHFLSCNYYFPYARIGLRLLSYPIFRGWDQGHAPHMSPVRISARLLRQIEMIQKCKNLGARRNTLFYINILLLNLN